MAVGKLDLQIEPQWKPRLPVKEGGVGEVKSSMITRQIRKMEDQEQQKDDQKTQVNPPFLPFLPFPLLLMEAPLSFSLWGCGIPVAVTW